MSAKRLPAIKVRIHDIVNGRFFKGDRENLQPSYLITSFGERISRVNVLATVIDKFINLNEDYATITLDDGSGSIRVKAFKDNVKLFSEIEKGDLVLVIGKVKEFNDEIYINAEIVRKLEDPNYELLRKVELLQRIYPKRVMVEEIKKLSEQVSMEELLAYAKEKYNLDPEITQFILQTKNLETDYKPKILEIIKELDKGDGVEIGKLFEVLNLPENVIEKAIDELLTIGELYEPLPGKLRRLA
ncbi:MAG: OB-fold nucleic acid binding domain-containing protein [Candidatus Aenigmatarchaeota archaeon]